MCQTKKDTHCLFTETGAVPAIVNEWGGGVMLQRFAAPSRRSRKCYIYKIKLYSKIEIFL